MNEHGGNTNRLGLIVSELRAAARAVQERRGGPLPAGSSGTRPAARGTNVLLRRALVVTILLGTIGTITGAATFSNFSSVTTNDNNTYAAGTVFLTDNDAAAFMYQVAGKKPGDVVTTCIKLTYTGTLPATVKLYTTSTMNALATYVTLAVDRGHLSSGAPAFPLCTNFVSDSVIYSGTLAAFATANNTYATGLAAYPLAQTQWNTNDTVYYRFTLTLQDNNLANGFATPLTTGTHAFTWEAQNQ